MRHPYLLAACAAVACSGTDRASMAVLPPVNGDSRLFSSLPPAYTGVDFENRLIPTNEFNVFTYRNFYNGGGVATGDLTGDHLPELVLTANQGGPRLYLNLGLFRFRDVTDEAGLGSASGLWTTGVTMADVNGDGRLDIYVCRAGRGKPEQRANALFIHQGLDASGVPRFRDMAAEYGVADQGYSIHALFLDYDRDGRLDLFVLNNSPRAVTSFAMRATDRELPDRFGGHKLYRNTGGRFEDVSRAAGIHEPEFAFGLGGVASDLNGDGWPDIYVANDFFEKDYFYVNNRDGTFTESVDRRLATVSYSSMGMDIADVNNDGRPDIYTTDMLPEDEYRFKLTTVFENWSSYRRNVKNGYHHQFTRNMLHLNNGNDTFTEVGQLAGVAKTDWSWSALIADFDLDGAKDIFVTNGITKDVTSQDYLEYLASQRTAQSMATGTPVDFLKLVEAAPATKLPDYMFRNNGDLTFTNQSAAWGLNVPNFSSGAAYADLDGDGGLDLVVNNVDDTALVFRNNIRFLSAQNNFLTVRLEGDSGNRFAVGAAVTLWTGREQRVQEVSPARGYQSSVDYSLTFGLGTRDTVDSVVVRWPRGRRSAIARVAANQRITLREASADAIGVTQAGRGRTGGALLVDVTDSIALPFTHRENEFADFDREPLMPKLVSTEGPALAVADVNGDGLDDMYLGGAKGQPGVLLVQDRDGRFTSSSAAEFISDSLSEDVGALFFDANGDGRVDLYVVSGGSEYSTDAEPLQDRLYLNAGGGRFRKSEGSLPRERLSGSRAVAGDFDGDGDQDLFVGGRVVPWQYGTDAPSLLLRNDGRGRFADVTAALAPGLQHAGMVTDAAWHDVDRDGQLDLVVTGEWMPVALYRNAGGRLARAAMPGLERSEGWWNRLVVRDVTGDGRADLLLGNVGLNTRLAANDSEPLTMYVKDFTRRGFVQQILCNFNQGKSYPVAIRDELIMAVPSVRSRVGTYKEYARRGCDDLFPRGEIADAAVKQARTLATALARGDGNRFTLQPLPRAAQVAPVYGILPADVNGDGVTDLLLAGNFDGVKPEIGRMAASSGLVLIGDGKGGFTPLTPLESGFAVPGQSRDIQRVRTARGDLVVVARNNDRPLVFRMSGGTTVRPGRGAANGARAGGG